MNVPYLAPPFTVPPDWTDYNGHLNMAYFIRIFDLSLDTFFDILDLGEGYAKRANAATFTLESRVRYTREVLVHQSVHVYITLLGYDHKRIHILMQMHHAEEEWLAATMEIVLAHVSHATRRTSPFPAETHATIARIHETHAHLSRPKELDSPMGLKKIT